MVTIRYKGHKPTHVRTDGGRSIALHPGEVHTFDETNKRYSRFVKKLLTQSDIFEVQRDVGAKKVGGGVRTRSRSLGTKEKVDCPKGSYKCKGVCKCETVKKPKGLKKAKRAD
tara:strand:- start:270 stop:608 length:339 start_codon:yes stop_codon:yes gene_type:complete